jgi:hypothetical protein
LRHVQKPTSTIADERSRDACSPATIVEASAWQAQTEAIAGWNGAR